MRLSGAWRQWSSVKRVAALSCATVLLTLAGAGGAAATIVPGQSIDGVRLGDSSRTMTRLLGAPSMHATCQRVSGFRPCGPAVQFWFYTKLKLYPLVLHGRVAQLISYSSKQRTASGIGPGVSMNLVRAKYSHGANGREGVVHGYFIPRAPSRNGQLFTAVIGSSADELGGHVESVDIGRWSTKYACDFYGC
jgi:hypothetical protein